MLFWNRLWTSAKHISATIWTIGKKHVNLQGLPYMPPKFGELWSRNRWRYGEFLLTPLIFALGDTASLTACMSYNRQQANFGTCYVVALAYSLEQQNAGRAHTGLCHASSISLVLLLIVHVCFVHWQFEGYFGVIGCYVVVHVVLLYCFWQMYTTCQTCRSMSRVHVLCLSQGPDRQLFMTDVIATEVPGLGV